MFGVIIEVDTIGIADDAVDGAFRDQGSNEFVVGGHGDGEGLGSERPAAGAGAREVDPIRGNTDFSHWNLSCRFRWSEPGRCSDHLLGSLIRVRPYHAGVNKKGKTTKETRPPIRRRPRPDLLVADAAGAAQASRGDG